MLTATPINNRLSDFRHMVELFTRRDEAYFARTLGVNNLRAHFNKMEKDAAQASSGTTSTDVSEHIAEAQEILATDAIFQELVVQRSRAYARESQIRETGKAAAFPGAQAPQVAEYSIRKTYGRLLDMFEKAFTRKKPLFTLPIYYPLAYYKGPDKSIDPFEKNRQKQVVGLIRTNFLKRFESSVVAFELSCDRLLEKLLAFVEVHSETDAEKKRLERWKLQNAEILGYARTAAARLLGRGRGRADDEDIVPQELLDAVEQLDRDEYDVDEMIDETFLDLDQIVHFLDEARKFEPKHDDKLQKLIRLLKSKELAGQKVLIFTEFADTARYLQATARRGRHRRRRAGRQRDQGATAPTSSSASRPTTTAPSSADARSGGPRRDPRPDLDRRPVRRPEPPGRHAADQLRHPLEPGPADAADRPRRPADEPRGREAAGRRPSGGRSRPAAR